MKKLINISQKWRKLTAVILLFSFAVTPLLNAFPQEECNGVCEMDSVMHKCNGEITDHSEMSCCDMMDMTSTVNSSDSAECEMELSDINCALVYREQANESYVLPKTIDSKVEFIQVTVIDFQNDNSNIELFELIHEFSFKNKPPIYLTISSFLN